VSVLLPLLATLLVWGAVPPESPVADAAMRGDVEAVRALLERGADVNAPQGDGMTALHWAAELGEAALAAVLLDAGADPAASTRLGAYTPLHLASREGHAGIVAALLEAGADVHAATSTGAVTPLHFAAAASSAETVKELLDAGADPNARETQWQMTPLMFAAAAGRAPVIEVLLKGGADPGLTARVIDMPTREAQDEADQERREARMAGVELPENGGAPQEARGPGRAQLAEQTRDREPQPMSRAEMIGAYGGLSALLLAVREGNEEATLALLDGGADINAPSAADHTPPLLMATINGHFDLAMELLERGADPNGMNDAGAGPLYTTINTQWIPKSRHPQPADYMQQETSYLTLMKALLDAGADVNARLKYQLWFTTFGDDYLGVDRMGATPFWRAAYALDVPAMRLLVEHGADPSIPTMRPPEGRRRGGGGDDGPDPSGLAPVPPGGPGVFPIHAASGVGYGEGYAANIHRHAPNGWIPALKYLIEELGADVNARDFNGYNAVHNAASRGDNETILYLVEKGADVTAVSREGQTTVDMANGPYQRITPFPATIRLLESLGAKNNHNCVSC
jgi:ankyrin repeat protein